MVILQSLRKIFTAKEPSIATGVFLAALAWALTRLVDSVGAYNTLEYDVKHESTTLANGSRGYLVRVRLTNLSGDTTLKSLVAQISAQSKDVQFSDDVHDYHCTSEPPGWVGQPRCQPLGIGFRFEPVDLVAGTYVGLEAKYTRANGSTEEPVLRIQLPSEQNFRLIETGWATRALRYQTGILLTFGVLMVVLLYFSMSASVRKRATPKPPGEKP